MKILSFSDMLSTFLHTHTNTNIPSSMFFGHKHTHKFTWLIQITNETKTSYPFLCIWKTMSSLFLKCPKIQRSRFPHPSAKVETNRTNSLENVAQQLILSYFFHQLSDTQQRFPGLFYENRIYQYITLI